MRQFILSNPLVPFTALPWRVVDELSVGRGPGGGEPSPNKLYVEHFIALPHRRWTWIAEIPGGKRIAEAEANAYLIAAAPVLYTACNTAALALAILDEHHGRKENLTREMLEEACALARGLRTQK